MTIKVSVGKLTSKESVKLKGATLKDLLAEVKKSGIKDQNGKRQFAVTDTLLETDIGLRRHSNQIDIVTKIKAPVRKTKIKFRLKDVTVSVSGHIRYCVPKDYRKLSKPEQAEWDRFFGELMRHETQHFVNAVSVSNTLARDLQKCMVEIKIDYFDPGSPYSVTEAKTKAAEKLKKLKFHVGAASVALLGAKDNALDLLTGHGSTEGAKLRV